MQYWIEVSGDYQWKEKIKMNIGLNASNSNRYRNMFKRIECGDIILHHITYQRAQTTSHQSAIVGISRTSSKMHLLGNKLVLDLADVIELTSPIKLKEYSKINKPSKKFQFIINTNIQRYLLEIEKNDMKKIIEIKKENELLLMEHQFYQKLIKNS